MFEPPQHSFASDNAAGIAAEVLSAIADANHGSAIAYGADAVTAEFQERIRELFGPDATALLAWGGTGANIVGLSTLVAPYQSIICPAGAHINVDECGAAQRFIGCKLVAVPTADGKLRPADIEAQLHVLGNVHHVQPGAISITQSTELGTLYSVPEVRALCDTAKAAGLRVHMDGARVANAAAALDVPVREFTVDVGVDVLSFGGTKNGIAYGEAVVVLNPDLAEAARFHQKQAAQLPSKMRFVAAQFNALLTNDLWLRHARHANEMAQRLAKGAADIEGVKINQAVEVNAVFANLESEAIKRLQAWSYFYAWPPVEVDSTGGSRSDVRWMTSFETTEQDVDRFIDAVAREVA